MHKIYTGINPFQKIIVSICLIYCFSFTQNQGLLAQCSNNNAFFLDMSPTTVGQTVSTACIWAGDYATVSVCNGAQYTFETCAGSFDTQVTIRDNASPFGVLAFNDDACSLQSRVIWTATFTGVVRVLVDRYPCSHVTACHSLAVTWNTGCAATGNPGDDCNRAIPVACGNTYTNQASIGNGNTESTWGCTTLSTPGEDRYYALTVSDPSATVVRVTINNVVDTDTYLEVIQAGSTCSGATCNRLAQYDIAAGTFNSSSLNSFDFPVSGAGTWYFIVDSQADGVSSFDIGFECLSSGIQWDTSGCVGPPADTDNNGYEVTWNGGPPGPVWHNDVGTICVTLYVTNPNASGWEWLKRVNLNLGSCWTNVQNIVPNTPPGSNGFYNLTGSWSGIYIPGINNVNYTFTNSSNALWGDGNAAGMTCAQYTFCFQATIDTSQCGAGPTNGTDILLFAEDDGVGGFGSTQPSSSLGRYSLFFLQNNVLPVEMANFEARIVQNIVRLDWTTLSETNNDHFRVERSGNGQNYLPLGTISGSGNSQERVSYTHVDAYPLPGENHYRLVQVDQDGAEAVVGQQVLYFVGQDGVELLNFGPNPAQKELVLHISAQEASSLSVQARDQMGRLVQTFSNKLSLGEHTLKLDIQNWPAGIYFLRIQAADMEKTIKVMKLK
ncbi:MAG TPA: T9SS type A sorting domain-containing protein [Bacteroidetes bacterium]|nr:T9SS type A sorting domain-containing protein [Bacteroidota bacterium]